jgi:anti-sigma B factor antagonist
VTAERPLQPLGGVRAGGSKQLVVEVHPAGSERETHVVEVRGEIDVATVSQLEEKLAVALSRDGRPVIADLSGCEFIDSAGISALLWAAEGDGSASRLIAIIVRDGPVKHTLEQIGVDKLLPVLATPASSDGGGADREEGET